MKFGIIGAGLVGTALAVRLTEKGHECIGVHTRSEASYQRFRNYLNLDHLAPDRLAIEADVLFITTQDSMIRSVAENLNALEEIKEGQYWIHCSGSLNSSVLRINPELPVKCLSIHPLQAFADIKSALTLLSGTHFGVEGEGEEFGMEIVKTLGGIPHRLDSANKSLYHAGAVVASNYFVVLADLAVRLFALAGIDGQEALESLIPLMKGTLHNLSEVKLPQALTGPIARGDAGVVRGHLAQMPSELADTYRTLGREALKIGKLKLEEQGLEYPDQVIKELEELLEVL